MLGPSTQGKPGAGKTNFSPVQSLLWFLSCWKCFTSPETKLGMDKERHTLLFDAAPHYTDLVLQCLLNLRDNKHSVMVLPSSKQHHLPKTRDEA